MDFIDELKQFSKVVSARKDNIQTEEATKTSVIMPFFALLGYDVFNPNEFVPEYTADVGIKKGEKVDYAILNNGKPVILIECKWIGEPLEKHDSQLFRYFGTSEAKFAILTNGMIYRFYTDLDAENKMDEKPFLEINILNIKENQIAELKKFCKSNFNLDEIIDAASELKYSNEFKARLATELQTPCDDLVRLFLTDTYSGLKTQSVLDRFRGILKKSLNEYISELMNDKIKSALGTDMENKPEEAPVPPISEENSVSHEPQIVTTDEELGAYFIVKSILKGIVSPEDITYKDTVNYINILYKGNTRKWICRFAFQKTNHFLILPSSDKRESRYSLNSIYDIEDYKDQLMDIVKGFIE